MLVQSINISINPPEDRLSDDVVKDAFTAFWPPLKKTLETLPTAEAPDKPKRSLDDMLAEVLDLCRLYLPQIGTAGDTAPLSTYRLTVGDPAAGTKFDKLAALSQILSAPSATNVQLSGTYHIKQKGDGEVKMVTGALGHSGGKEGGLIVHTYDRGSLFFPDVERWWTD